MNHTQAAPPASLEAVTHLSVNGMNCANCVRTVTNTIQSVSGVASAVVSLEAGSAEIRWNPNTSPNPDSLIQSLKAAGYEAHSGNPLPTGRSTDWSPTKGWKFNVVVGLSLTIPLMLAEWVFDLGMNHTFQWVAFAMALPVQILCGTRFYKGAWSQIKVGASNMDTLVTLGSSTAFLYSAWALFAGWHTHLYFMEAASIITLISVGHWIESLASANAARSLNSLLHLAPEEARRLSMDGKETMVPVASLRPKDTVLLKPGDRVPVDGEIRAGRGSADESMLTGESLPVEKQPGSPVFAGTLNVDGRLVVTVTALGANTALARIVQVVQQAQTSRAQIQRLADKISNVFVPIVVLIALVTGLAWGFALGPMTNFAQHLAPFLWPLHLPADPLAAAIVHIAAVLIVACPCAMGLATPAAMMVCSNVASTRGILIRDAQAIEKSGLVTAVVFDKTGTLTEGKLKVTATWTSDPSQVAARDFKPLVAALTRGSNHPVSRGIALELSTKAPPIAVNDFLEVPGAGITATFNGSACKLGSLSWLEREGVDLSPCSAFVEKWSSQGATFSALAVANQISILFALSDSIKPHSPQVVSGLMKNGIQVYMMTGDNPKSAAAIGLSVGIPVQNIHAGLAPGQKLEVIRKLQQSGQRVAFVGDGINDAPALEQADLGVAVSKASDVAREAADIILINSDIQAVPEAIGLAQATLRVIKQNLFWAFFYNAAAIPLAALGFLSPVICAATMGISDVVVIGNALRLRRWTPHP